MKRAKIKHAIYLTPNITAWVLATAKQNEHSFTRTVERMLRELRERRAASEARNENH